MFGQTAYDWNTTPHSRFSGGRSMSCSWSNTTRSPTRCGPASGRCRPAIDHSVVDFPQPLGPSSVSNSPALPRWRDRVERDVVVERLGQAGDLEIRHRDCTPHNSRPRPSTTRVIDTWINAERGDRAGRAGDPELEHRQPHDLGPRRHHEHRRVVVVEHRDEHQDERHRHRRPQQPQHDRRIVIHQSAPDVRAARSRSSPERVQRRVEGAVAERQAAHGEGDADPPQRGAHLVDGSSTTNAQKNAMPVTSPGIARG